MLKLGRSRNAYDILGLPRNATGTQIRSRYRHLVRNYKKDSAPSALLEDEQFQRWTNSYLLLLGPERREYDRRLRQSRGMAEPEDTLSGLSEGRRLMIQAETAFHQRKLNSAVELGKEAIKRESKNANAFALLGDILREQGRYANALTMYNYAIQFEPNSRRFWQRLEEVTALRDGKSLPKKLRQEARRSYRRPLWMWLVVAAAVVAVEGSMLYLRGDWGELGLLNLPVKLTYAALASGFLLGLVLAAAALVGPFDDEMFWYQISGFGTELVPLGVFIALPGIVFFWAAPAFYVIISLLDEHFSASVAIALAVCGLVTVGFGFVVPEVSRHTVVTLGGNFVFAGFLGGWLIGSIRRRVFEH
ncbi:MAG: DnaJ domain-containing protein [Armatimonadetes bacterium]|nr:DnaJ domain-containing protein [Armatimonadota bacterium]